MYSINCLEVDDKQIKFDIRVEISKSEARHQVPNDMFLPWGSN